MTSKTDEQRAAYLVGSMRGMSLPVGVLAQQFAAVRAEGAAEERRKIVEWLRESDGMFRPARTLAEKIERGDHLRGEGE